MKIKRLIPILFSFSLLAMGCERGEKVKEAKQEFAKSSMLSVEFLQQNSENFTEKPYKFSTKSIIENSVGSGYTKINDSNIGSYGFAIYRDTLNKYHYYSFHKGDFVEAVNTNNGKVYMGNSSYVGRYIAIYNTETSDYIIYNSLGRKVVRATYPQNYSTYDSYNEKNGLMTFEYYDNGYKTITYNPSSGESETPATSSTIGDYKGNISLKDYGHPDMSLRYQERKVDVFQNDRYVKSYNLPYSKDYAQILGDNLVFLMEHQLPFDANKYQYSTSSGYGMPIKATQEIYLLNYVNGQRTSLTSDYYISYLNPLKDDEGNLTVASANFYEIRKDKTVSPSSYKYLIDSNFVVYDNITNVDLGDAMSVNTSTGTYFVTSSGKVYDKSLNVYRDFSTDLTNFSYSTSGKYIVGIKDGKYGVANINGNVEVQFKYEGLYFDPDLASLLIGYRDGEYFLLTKQNGTYNETTSNIISISNCGSFYAVYKETGTDIYSKYGELVQSFGVDVALAELYGDQGVTIKYANCKYATLEYNEGSGYKTLLMSFKQN